MWALVPGTSEFSQAVNEPENGALTPHLSIPLCDLEVAHRGTRTGKEGVQLVLLPCAPWMGVANQMADLDDKIPNLVRRHGDPGEVLPKDRHVGEPGWGAYNLG